MRPHTDSKVSAFGPSLARLNSMFRFSPMARSVLILDEVIFTVLSPQQSISNFQDACAPIPSESPGEATMPAGRPPYRRRQDGGSPYGRNGRDARCPSMRRGRAGARPSRGRMGRYAVATSCDPPMAARPTDGPRLSLLYALESVDERAEAVVVLVRNRLPRHGVDHRLDVPPERFAEGVVRPVPAVFLEDRDAVPQVLSRARPVDAGG